MNVALVRDLKQSLWNIIASRFLVDYSCFSNGLYSLLLDDDRTWNRHISPSELARWRIAHHVTQCLHWPKQDSQSRNINLFLLPLGPEPHACSWALSTLPVTIAFWQDAPDFSHHEEVHHNLIALLNRIVLSHLHRLASGCFPVFHRSHGFSERFVWVSSLPAVAEEVLPQLGHCRFTPPAFAMFPVAKLVQVDSSRSISTLWLVESGSQQFRTCHWDGSLGPRFVLESVTEVLVALVNFPLC
jgi:hypothetical protein